MHLYHWSSAAMKRYSNGDLVVMAADVESAREIIRAAIVTIHEQEWSWFDPTNEDDVEARAKFATALEEDIAKEPTVAPGYVSIWGSS